MSERDSFRAAGQAYAAAVLGVPIKAVTVTGIELNWPTNRVLSDADWIAEIGLGLTGIAAVARYGFGSPPSGPLPFSYDSLDELQGEDFDKVSELVDMVDPTGSGNVMPRGWRFASDIVCSDETWAAIEWLAGIIEGVDLDGVAVTQIVGMAG